MILQSQRVLVDGSVRAAAIHVDGGRITAITAPVAAPDVHAGHALVMPGVVDTHVHVNEPGRTEWEGFQTATRAAAAGGVTTLVDMPLNSIPATTSLRALDEKRAAAEGKCGVDGGFSGSSLPGNVAELGPRSGSGYLRPRPRPPSAASATRSALHPSYARASGWCRPTMR